VANVTCATCGDSSHITLDCPHKDSTNPLQAKAKLDDDYKEFMAMIEGGDLPSENPSNPSNPENPDDPSLGGVGKNGSSSNPLNDSNHPLSSSSSHLPSVSSRPNNPTSLSTTTNIPNKASKVLPENTYEHYKQKLLNQNNSSNRVYQPVHGHTGHPVNKNPNYPHGMYPQNGQNNVMLGMGMNMGMYSRNNPSVPSGAPYGQLNQMNQMNPAMGAMGALGGSGYYPPHGVPPPPSGTFPPFPPPPGFPGNFPGNFPIPPPPMMAQYNNNYIPTMNNPMNHMTTGAMGGSGAMNMGYPALPGGPSNLGSAGSVGSAASASAPQPPGNT